MASSNRNSSSPRKLALIIGNEKYQSDNKLRYSFNNANDLSNALRSINFNITTVHDASQQDIMNNVIDFRNKINNGDLVLFYFSGHVYQVNNKKYLLPTNDSSIEEEGDVEEIASDFERIVRQLVEKNPSYTTIFILDYFSPYKLLNEQGAKRKYCGKLLRQHKGVFV